MAIQHLQEQYELNGAKCFLQDGAPQEQVNHKPPLQHMRKLVSRFLLGPSIVEKEDNMTFLQIYTTPEELHCAVLYNVLALLAHVEPEVTT